MLLLKVNEVIIENQKLPKISKNSIKSPFLPEGPKKHGPKAKALVEVGPRSRLYL